MLINSDDAHDNKDNKESFLNVFFLIKDYEQQFV